jgi:hypothetical protein
MLSLDSELANQVLDSVSKALSEFDQNYLYSAKNLNMNLISRTTLESLKRIIEYSADISEIVVNLSVQKGKTRSDLL